MKQFAKLAVLSILFIWGCGTTSYITNSWKAQDVQPKKFKKVVVLGLVRDVDITIRQKMEQHIAGDLKALGYDAVCSCDEYNPKTFDKMTEEEAVAKIRNSGVDAVITVTLLDKKKERQYVPGRYDYPPLQNQVTFYRYYHTMYERIYTPGYFQVNTRYFWESNFYDLGTNQLLYSAQSQSFEPASTEKLSHEYGQMIVKDMLKNKIVSDQKEVPLKGM
jgi:hypothetical protein